MVLSESFGSGTVGIGSRRVQNSKLQFQNGEALGCSIGVPSEAKNKVCGALWSSHVMPSGANLDLIEHQDAQTGPSRA